MIIYIYMNDWYTSWHNHSKHPHTHWAAFLMVAILTANFLLGEINTSTFQTPEAEAASSVLLTSDLTCAGVFLTPSASTGSYTSSYPVAMRYENGNRHYFMYSGNGDVIGFPEPTLSPCNTPLTSVNRAKKESWGGNWGKFNVGAATNVIPGAGASYAMGLNYDNPTNQLILSWTNTYSGSPPHNSFAAAAPDNTTHKLTTTGCWGLSNINQPLVGGGVLNIPSSFVSSYLPSGARWGVGWGGAVASYVGLSLGPTLFAVPPPSSNPCAPGVDNFISSGTVLSKYGQNSSGPNCHNFRTSVTASGPGLGCNPTKAPTAPLHAKMSFNNYSTDMYAPDWNPYQGGNGWFNNSTQFSMGWYDDGVKQGVVVPFLTTAGWANTTVLASPAPTYSTTSGYYPSGVMYVASTSTHDGNNMNPGDWIWIQTCAIGIDPNCAEGGNNRHLSFAVVDSVNPSTGAVAYHIMSPDFSTGSHAPVPGGAVYHGCLYAHGAPTCSRATYRLQIYDPAQYAQVIAGTRQAYDVTYNQEMDLTTFVKGFGSPSMGKGVEFGNEHHAPVSVMTDPAAHQIMIAFTNDSTSLYSVSNAIYVFNVGPNAVTPPVASPSPTPTPAPAPAPAPAPSPSPTPSPVQVPGQPSANCTKAATVTDALGHVWTFSWYWTLRDGTYSLPGGGALGGAQGTIYKIVSGVTHVLDPRDSTWYRWNETTKTFTKLTTTEPTCTTSTPAPAPAPTPTPSPVTIVGDINNDGIVNSLDWSIMSSKWFSTDSASDLNKDGIVNSIDFSIMNNNWLKTG